MKKALIIYYSQAEQTRTALKSFARGLQKNIECDWVEIKSKENFQFPWKIQEFFRAFPRAVQGLAPEVSPLGIQWDQYDLVILGWQVWFLSPSLPIQGFLGSPEAHGLAGKKVITIATCRNLWHSASNTLKKRLLELNAKVLGQIIVAETSPVWASFVTTPRWMLTGKKEAFAFFPQAGIGEEHFIALESKGEKSVRWSSAQGDWLVTESEFGSNLNRVSLVLMDRIGYRFFRLWSAFILRLAPQPGMRQDIMLIFFRLNLVIMIITFGPCTKLFELLVRNHPRFLKVS